MCVCTFTLTSTWEKMKEPRDNLLCRDHFSVSHGERVVQGVGGNFPHQTMLMIAHGGRDSPSALESLSHKGTLLKGYRTHEWEGCSRTILTKMLCIKISTGHSPRVFE